MYLLGSFRRSTPSLMLEVCRGRTILRPKYNTTSNAPKQLQQKHNMIECQHPHYIAIYQRRSAENAGSYILEFPCTEKRR